MSRPLTEQELELLSQASKRAQIVIAHILEHGKVTTEELEQLYGYKHPPRAARDVREAGIPLKTIKVKSLDGCTIGAYILDDASKVRRDRIGGRQAFPKEFERELYRQHEFKCAICQSVFDARYLQTDHRVPYEVAGEGAGTTLDRELSDYMPLCGSCNRAKSWSCENCDNYTRLLDPTHCRSCYWASPEDYAHIALEDIRRLALHWQGEETEDYTQLLERASQESVSLQELVKSLIHRLLESNE